MQPLPVKVKNVSVFAYFNPNEPLSEVILTGASGVYSVGTLMTSIFYNLDLTDEGRKENPLNVHSQYYATGETESGDKFTTPWMYCLDNSNQPKFGRTKTLVASSADSHVDEATVNESDYIKLGALTDITVSQLFPPPAIGQRLLIENGSGNIIATRVGTPHEMGVQVDSGRRIGEISSGMKRIIISGKTKDGDRFSQTGYTAVSGGDPAIFIKQFPN
ncbi:hypothetical protein [uncultured Psychroserpens sp.]|uniref:hypothetical protein n=1 Tax=uncultured Psychroserpens sp. TaxID=255436 RepID=UPI002609E587|nr:hypothetical protein [uncultured Psychroserpens sp.]